MLVRTEPTAPNRQNLRDAWLSYQRDHAPDAVGSCGDPSDGRTAIRRASRPGGTTRWGSDSHRAKRQSKTWYTSTRMWSRDGQLFRR